MARQHGVISTQQLHEVGHGRAEIRRLRANGVIEPVLRGTYRTPTAPFEELARCAAVCLANPALTIGGPTAGRLWTYRRVPRDHRIHVIAPPHSQPAIAPWIVPYRTAAIRPEDIVQRDDGIRVTSRARTVLDLARTLDIPDVRSIAEQAMHDGKLEIDDLLLVALDWRSPQRPWLDRYVRILAARRAGAPAESHPELIVGELLEAQGVRGLVRQYRIELPGYGPARFDLAVPHLQWAIEVDVHPTHDETEGRRLDRRRDRAADRIGWLVDRVSRREYQADLRSAVARLALRYQRLTQSGERTSGNGPSRSPLTPTTTTR
jgi:very-short-patch-repair endonuclease